VIPFLKVEPSIALVLVKETTERALEGLDVTYVSILDRGLEQACLFFLEFCVLAGVLQIFFSDTAVLDWTLDMLAYFRSVHDPDVGGRFGLRFPTGSRVSCTLFKILNMVLAEIEEFVSAFCESKDSKEDVFESLIGVHERVVDSETGRLATMHVLGEQSVGFASTLDTRL
jgi:hypothetical protein